MFRGNDAPKQPDNVEKKPTPIQEGKKAEVEKKEPPANKQEAEKREINNSNQKKNLDTPPPAKRVESANKAKDAARTAPARKEVVQPSVSNTEKKIAPTNKADVQQSEKHKPVPPEKKQESREAKAEKKAFQEDSKKLDKDFEKVKNTFKEANKALDAKAEKQKAYTDEYAQRVEKTSEKLDQAIAAIDKRIDKLDKDNPANKKELDSLSQQRNERVKQREEIKAIAEDVRDTQIERKMDDISKSYDKIDKARDSKTEKEKVHTPEFEQSINKTERSIQESVANLKEERNKLDQKDPANKDKLEHIDNKLHEREKQLEKIQAVKEDVRNTQIEKGVEMVSELKGKVDEAHDPERKKRKVYTAEAEKSLQKTEDTIKESIKHLQEEKSTLNQSNPEYKAKVQTIDNQIKDREKQLDKVQSVMADVRDTLVDKGMEKISKVHEKANEVKESEAKSEKQKLYSDEHAQNIDKTVDRLEKSISYYKSELAKLETKEAAPNEGVDQKVLQKRELTAKLNKSQEQLDKLRPLSQEVSDVREDKKLAQQQKSFENVYQQAQNKELSREEKQKLYSPEFVSLAEKQKEALEQRYDQVNARMSELEKAQKTDTPEYYRLKGERFERGRDIASMDIIVTEAKDFERSAALETSRERLNAVRGDSKFDKNRDLEKDRECVRNNRAVILGLEKDREKAITARDDVHAEISAMVNTYEREDLVGNEKFDSLMKQYDQMCDVVDTYDAQIKTLDMYNERLSEINGKDKDGNDLLPFKRDALDVDDSQVKSSIEDIRDRSKIDNFGERFDKTECLRTLATIEKTEREVIPSLRNQISGLDRDIAAADSYIKNYPDDKLMNGYRESLEKERAAKVEQLSCLVEGVTVLRDDLQVGDTTRSIKCFINSDGTYTLEQRWTNTQEKVVDKRFLKHKHQLYANAYDRVSTTKFDENGNSVSRDFAFKYKLLGIYSETKLGGDKFNVQNIFESGLMNINAKAGWDKEKHGYGAYAKADASVFEVSNTIAVNALNKKVFQVHADAALAKATAKAELDNGLPVVSISLDAGLAAKADAFVGKLQIVKTAYNKWTNQVSSKLSVPDAIDGKTGENIFKVKHEDGTTSSIAFGDKITIYERSNKNGEVEHTTVFTNFKDHFETANGINDLASQTGNIADIIENGLFKSTQKDNQTEVLRADNVPKVKG